MRLTASAAAPHPFAPGRAGAGLAQPAVPAVPGGDGRRLRRWCRDRRGLWPLA